MIVLQCYIMLDDMDHQITTLLVDNFFLSTDMEPSDVNSERTYKNWALGTNISFSATH
jgi:hypothetical protein